MKHLIHRAALGLGLGLAWTGTALADIPPPTCSLTHPQMDPMAAVASVVLGLGILFLVRRR